MHYDAAAAGFKDARKSSAPSVNKKPAQRIPPGGLEDVAKAVAFSTSPAMLLRSMREFRTYSLMVKSRAANGMNEPLLYTGTPLPFWKL